MSPGPGSQTRIIIRLFTRHHFETIVILRATEISSCELRDDGMITDWPSPRQLPDCILLWAQWLTPARHTSRHVADGSYKWRDLLSLVTAPGCLWEAPCYPDWARANSWGSWVPSPDPAVHFSFSWSQWRKCVRSLGMSVYPLPAKTNGFLLVSTLSPIYLDICQLIFPSPILLS